MRNRQQHGPNSGEAGTRTVIATAPIDRGCRSKPSMIGRQRAGGGFGVADGSVLIGALTPWGPLSGPLGGDCVSVELGQVVGRHH